jgi:hypothetical protein
MGMKLAMVLGVLLCTNHASAQHVDPAVDAVIMTLARQCVNESGFGSRVDCSAIWQATTNITRGPDRVSAAALADAQYRLSPAIADSLRWILAGEDTRSCERRNRWLTHGNIRWSLNLGWNDDEPEGWTAENDVPWDRVVHRWRSIRQWAYDRVIAYLDHRYRGVPVCHGFPITWGMRGGGDNRIMYARNERRVSVGLDPWVRLACTDGSGRSAVNEFWGRR